MDAGDLAPYREAKNGQIMEEGISEAGGLSSWIAAGTSHLNHGIPMIPFFVFYSMFGFQRVGDLIWAAADQRARGFLIGGTSGRTTLSGEGLQHQDGHSHIMAATVPRCVAYDPAFGYEVAVIVQDGLRRMYQDEEDVFYYITTLNENYAHPAMPAGAEESIRKGIYLFKESERQGAPRVQLLGSGAILREAIFAAEILETQYQVAADIWSVTSFTELRKDGLAVERHNRLHVGAEPRMPFVTRQLVRRKGPVIAATDYMRALADGIRQFVPAQYTVLGTDGFGRSDTREKLRSFFEVDRYHIVVAALRGLAVEGSVAPGLVAEAMAAFDIDPDRVDPSLA
jgi:pyruvate dehydrogenase E1 component